MEVASLLMVAPAPTGTAGSVVHSRELREPSAGFMKREDTMTRRERRARLEEPGVSGFRRFLRPESLLLLLGFLALAAVGPLREVLRPVSPLLSLAAFVLFMIPGVMLSRLIPERDLPGLAKLPAAFVFSTGVFGLPGIPMLLLHRSLTEYLWLCGGLLAASVLWAVFVLFRGKAPVEERIEAADRSAYSLWVPFAALVSVLAFAATRNVPAPGADTWLYLAYVQDFVERSRLAFYAPYSIGEAGSFSRLAINGWLLEQAALSKISGVAAVDLVPRHLAPALVVLTLLSVYSLSQMLFGNVTAALAIGFLTALYFLIYLNSSPFSPGGELIGRVAEDKFVARFILMPTVLGLAVVFLRERNPRLLGLLALAWWTIPVVHPLGLAFVGLPVAGLCALHFMLGRRERGTWLGVGGVALVLLSPILPAALYLLFSGMDPGTMTGSSDPARVAQKLYQAENAELLLRLGDASYIMHPSLLREPLVAGAYLLGVPFLIWRLKRSLAARALLGSLLLVPAVVYMPPVATFVGGIIGPWHLWRLAWPLPLAALLTLGWMAWEATIFAQRMLLGSGATRRAAPLLPALGIVLVTVLAAPTVREGLRSSDASGETAQNRTTCVDPAFRYMGEVVTEPAVVLAPAGENGCIPAYAALASVVSFRGQGIISNQAALQERSGGEIEAQEGALDANAFFSSPTLDEEMIRTLRRYGVGYALLPVGSPLNAQFRHLDGFTPMDTPGDRYRLYGVATGELWANAVVVANSSLNGDDAATAVSIYAQALPNKESTSFLAYLGLGYGYARERQFDAAIPNFEAALAIDPDEPVVYPELAHTYQRSGDSSTARATLERAVKLSPRDAELHLELGALLLRTEDEEAALRQYRLVTEMFPEVPAYRVELGEALLQTGDEGAAQGEFERAISADPSSASPYLRVGAAYQRAGLEERAIEYYERTLELDPGSSAAERLEKLREA